MTAIEKIADLTGQDVADLKDARYQPSIYNRPALYVVGGDYYAAGDKMPPRTHNPGKPWEKKTTFRGHTVWLAKMAD